MGLSMIIQFMGEAGNCSVFTRALRPLHVPYSTLTTGSAEPMQLRDTGLTTADCHRGGAPSQYCSHRVGGVGERVLAQDLPKVVVLHANSGEVWGLGR